MIKKETLEKVAEIARLKLSGKEIEDFTKDAEDILKIFSKIDEVDVKDIAPTFQFIPNNPVLRIDLIKESLTQGDALKNSVHKDKNFFKGPKII